jgi:uncharacterized repeat protein (TIGR01451 family)
MRRFSNLFKTAIIWCLCAGPVLAQTLETNAICYDPISGAGTFINAARTNGVDLLSGPNNANNIIDRDLSNFASLQAGVGALSTVSLSVEDSTNIYPAGNRVGFVVQSVGGLLNLSLLSNVTIKLFLNNVEVQSGSGGGDLLDLGLLSGSDNQQRIGLVAVSNFDEVQFSISSAVGLPSAIRVYQAFEEPTTCATECNEEQITAQNSSVQIVSARTGITAPTILGTSTCVGCAVTNESNLLNANLTDFATISFPVTVDATGSISIAVGAQSAGKEVGFAIAPGSGFLDLNLLSNISIATYLAGNLKENIVANSSLMNTTLLGSDGLSLLAFKTTQDFDEVRVIVAATAGVLATTEVYYAFLRTDTDNDGVYDCMDRCAGNDLLDNDGDGLPDDCDDDDDNDGLLDTAEATLGTNPFDGDTDDDGLGDGVEINGTGLLQAPTNPLLADSDGDGVLDGTEVGLTAPTAYTNLLIFVADADAATRTNPNLADTDSDNLSDGNEDANKNGRIDSGESDPNDSCDPVACQVDLSLTKTVDNNTPQLNGQVTFTLTVSNSQPFAVTNLEVTDLLPTGLTHVSHNANAGTSYDPLTGIWDIGAVMTSSVSSVELTIIATVTKQGITYNNAEISSLSQIDADSTPGNGVKSEDDYASVCVSVPYTLCSLDGGISIAVDNTYTSYQWLKDGIPVLNLTTSSIIVTEAGNYTVEIDGGSSCSTGLCCPFIVNEGDSPIAITAPVEVCTGLAIDLLATTAATVSNYLWSMPNGVTATTSTINIAAATVANAGEYVLHATLASGCIASDTVQVVVNAAILTTNLDLVCDNNNTLNDNTDDVFNFILNPTGGSVTTYSVSGNGISTTGLNYGTPSTEFGPYNIGDAAFSTTLTDDQSGCSIDAQITPPSACSTCAKLVCVPIIINLIN